MAYQFTIKGIKKYDEEKVVAAIVDLFHGSTDMSDVGVRCRPALGDITESLNFIIRRKSTQGTDVFFHRNGTITVELPTLASLSDVKFCYLMLKAVKTVYHNCHILNEDGRETDLSDRQRKRQWMKQLQNMDDIIGQDQMTVLKGAHRDFYITPAKYQGRDERCNRPQDAYDDFTAIQWNTPEAIHLEQEMRRVDDTDAQHSVRVTDNSADVFIEPCQYVGMMVDNHCKMVPFQHFCQLMSKQDEFHKMDAKQAILCQMDRQQWRALYRQAPGIVIPYFRKTFVMRWNTDDSCYKMADFTDAVEKFKDSSLCLRWDISEYDKVHPGDLCYMIRTGKGEHGVVMRGIIDGTPFIDPNDTEQQRHFVKLRITHIMAPDSDTELLTTQDLSQQMPCFDWENGKSGELLDAKSARTLENMWRTYDERMQKRLRREASMSYEDRLFLWMPSHKQMFN